MIRSHRNQCLQARDTEHLSCADSLEKTCTRMSLGRSSARDSDSIVELGRTVNLPNNRPVITQAGYLPVTSGEPQVLLVARPLRQDFTALTA